MHVRVVPLPEGEDPDSFARSHSSSELLEYIEKNEEDFIQFKARLLSKGVEGDPVKRANLITEVVRSVAVIPERIERSLYLAECAKILKVEENLLFDEAARFRRRKWEQDRKRGGFVPRDSRPVEKQRAKPTELANYPEEKELIRLMIAHGDVVITELKPNINEDAIPITVVDFILQEFEDDPMDFQSPLYAKMFAEIQEHHSKEFVIQNHFIQHQNPEISSMAVDLVSPEYELSKIHTKAGAYIQPEEQRLKETVPNAVIAFKSQFVKGLIDQIMNELKDSQNSNDIDNHRFLIEKIRSLDSYILQVSKDLNRTLRK